jgi:hypothetical protein
MKGRKDDLNAWHEDLQDKKNVRFRPIPPVEHLELLCLGRIHNIPSHKLRIRFPGDEVVRSIISPYHREKTIQLLSALCRGGSARDEGTGTLKDVQFYRNLKRSFLCGVNADMAAINFQSALDHGSTASDTICASYKCIQIDPVVSLVLD